MCPNDGVRPWAELRAPSAGCCPSHMGSSGVPPQLNLAGAEDIPEEELGVRGQEGVLAQEWRVHKGQRDLKVCDQGSVMKVSEPRPREWDSSLVEQGRHFPR